MDVKHIFISVDVCEFVAAEADTIVYESCMHTYINTYINTIISLQDAVFSIHADMAISVSSHAHLIPHAQSNTEDIIGLTLLTHMSC